MSEIEKMYRTAKVVPSHHYCNDCQYDMSAECPIKCPDNVAVYPPFTAEKQLELIKWLLKKDLTDGSIITYFPREEKYFCLFDWEEGLPESDLFENFEEALACVFNYIWQSLTEEEKQQVREILK